jgi:hypothetical protein
MKKPPGSAAFQAGAGKRAGTLAVSDVGEDRSSVRLAHIAAPWACALEQAEILNQGKDDDHGEGQVFNDGHDILRQFEFNIGGRILKFARPAAFITLHSVVYYLRKVNHSV